jgi:hypothetical protein
MHISPSYVIATGDARYAPHFVRHSQPGAERTALVIERRDAVSFIYREFNVDTGQETWRWPTHAQPTGALSPSPLGGTVDTSA